jgi:hypothetical protein
MAVADYNVTPSLNVTISGINVNTGCPAGNLDNAIRQMMADIRVEYSARLDPDDYVPKVGGSFTGQIARTGKGGYYHSGSTSDLGGTVHFIAFGGALPSGRIVGDWVAELEA